MDVVHCKDCTHYKVCIKDGNKYCELFLDGLFNAKENDFCSFASTEDNEDAGFDCDYQGVRCKDCGWYDGYYEECLYNEYIPNLGIRYVGLGAPQPHDFCSHAERKVFYEEDE